MVSLGLCLDSAHQACASSLGSQDWSRQAERWAWSHQLWQPHCKTGRRLQGHPCGTMKGKHSAGTSGTWPHIPARSLNALHQRSCAPSQSALTDGAWAWETLQSHCWLQASFWLKKHTVQAESVTAQLFHHKEVRKHLFVCFRSMSKLYFFSRRIQWLNTLDTAQAPVCYQGGMKEGHRLSTPSRLSLKP